MTINASQPENSGRLIVQINRELEDLVPPFLSNRRKDIQTLRQALAAEDFPTIRMLGHRMKGDGGGYGFDRISEIGAAMERAAEERDSAASKRHIDQLEEFLNLVLVIYV